MLYSGFNILHRSVFWSAYFNGRSDNLDVIRLKIMVRFTTAHLLLVFPAWVVSYLLAPYATMYGHRISWRHVSAANDIRSIRLFAENQVSDEPRRTFKTIDFAPFWSDIGKNGDPWGNAYQIIELEYPKDEFSSNVHAYSFGEDGYSKTNGNDIDDINSWDYDYRKYYGAKIAQDNRRKFAQRTIWLTPLTYIAMLLLYKFAKPDHAQNGG